MSNDAFGFEPFQHGTVNVLNEGQDHALPLDFSVQHHFGGDGGRIADRTGHGRVSVAAGLAVADQVDAAQFVALVRPQNVDLVAQNDQVAVRRSERQPFGQILTFWGKNVQLKLAKKATLI